MHMDPWESSYRNPFGTQSTSYLGIWTLRTKFPAWEAFYHEIRRGLGELRRASQMGFPQIRGTILGGPSKDASILGSISGSLIPGNYQIPSLTSTFFRNSLVFCSLSYWLLSNVSQHTRFLFPFGYLLGEDRRTLREKFLPQTDAGPHRACACRAAVFLTPFTGHFFKFCVSSAEYVRDLGPNMFIEKPTSIQVGTVFRGPQTCSKQMFIVFLGEYACEVQGLRFMVWVLTLNPKP